MSGCTHPQVAQVFDRIRGTMTCSYCGEVVADQQYELDPAFNRGDKPAGGRPPPGFARPMRTTLLSNPGTNRPSIENARRGMQAIARQLEISQDDVEKAVAIFRLAVSNNAIAGSRPSALCACLYAICRRANTPHTIFDFADATKETPQSILSYLRTICRATSTQLPSPDPTFYVHRLAQLLNLGSQTEVITILAVKILRAMNEEWLGYGRRPLGLCGAAVLVAANAFGVQRNVNDVVNFVRLSPDTILLRMNEFLKTDACSLVDIDDYKPSAKALPPALLRKQNHDWVQESSDRYLAHLYYTLLNEAKESAPYTEERAARWREFIHQHCKVHNLEITEDVIDLSKLSSSQQLEILGIQDATPSSAEAVNDIKESESTRLIVSAAVAALGADVPTVAVARTPSNSNPNPSQKAENFFDTSAVKQEGLGANEPIDLFASSTSPTQSTNPSAAIGFGGSLDSVWGAMGGSTGESVVGNYGGEPVDEFTFAGSSLASGFASGNDFGYGDDRFGFGSAGNDFGFENRGESAERGQVKKIDEAAAKVEGIKKEMMSSQVTSVHAMLQRFDQLRALNNDVTSHVANVVQKAKFEIIVLPPVHSDLGLQRPIQETAGQVPSADPFATATITSASGTSVTVKSEPISQLSHYDGTRPNADETSGGSAGQSSVIKISDLLSAEKNITTTEGHPNSEVNAASSKAKNDQNIRNGHDTISVSTTQLASDLQMYIIQDLEVRLRLEAAGKRVFGEKWDAGAAKGDDEVLQAEIRACVTHGDDIVEIDATGAIVGQVTAPQRRRMKIRRHATAAQAIKESLRNKGASQIDVNAIFGEEDLGKDGDFDPNNGDMSDNEGGGWDD